MVSDELVLLGAPGTCPLEPEAKQREQAGEFSASLWTRPGTRAMPPSPPPVPSQRWLRNRGSPLRDILREGGDCGVNQENAALQPEKVKDPSRWALAGLVLTQTPAVHPLGLLGNFCELDKSPSWKAGDPFFTCSSSWSEGVTLQGLDKMPGPLPLGREGGVALLLDV